VEEWAHNGWIVPAPADCQWNIPLLAADKLSHNGGPSGVHVCLDARMVNDLIVSVVDSNLPGCREILDTLEAFQWISVADSKSPQIVKHPGVTTIQPGDFVS
jgi:hypothetical protein